LGRLARKTVFSRVFPQFAECLLVGCALVMLGLRKRGVNAAFFCPKKTGTKHRINLSAEVFFGGCSFFISHWSLISP
jgi:hypothetical protein